MTPAPVRDFSALFAPLQPHLAELNRFLHAQLGSFEPEIRGLADYCIDTSGKRIRPALVFFGGWQGENFVSGNTVKLAAVIELVHLATLVHDDIMDGAEMRRNRPTASKAYGPEAAVLLGDALLAHAVYLAAQFPTPAICRAVSEATRRVCSGEIVQTLRRGHANLSLADYRRIIDLKTAELFRLSCELGAQLAGYGAEYVNAVARFGRHLGIAYQIYDDLADFYGEEKRIGKTLGTDLASGKPTLPLLILISKLSGSERTDLVDEIEKRHPPRIELRIHQMIDHGIFGDVTDAILSELNLAAAALAPWKAEPPTPMLLPLCELLRAQVLALQPTPA